MNAEDDWLMQAARAAATGANVHAVENTIGAYLAYLELYADTGRLEHLIQCRRLRGALLRFVRSGVLRIAA